MRLTLLMMDSSFLWFRGNLFRSPILCFRILWGQILWRMVHNVVIWIWPHGILLGVCNIGLATTIAMLLTTACQSFLFKIRQRLLWGHRGILVHGNLRWDRMKWLMWLLNLLVRVLGFHLRWLCKSLWTGLFGRMWPRALSTVQLSFVTISRFFIVCLWAFIRRDSVLHLPISCSSWRWYHFAGAIGHVVVKSWLLRWIESQLLWKFRGGPC